jgi:hypothetical protein
VVADTGRVSPSSACARCQATLGLSRWCPSCGLDLRSDLPDSQIPEARLAAAAQQRWLSEHAEARPVPGVPGSPAGPEAVAAPGGAFLPPAGAALPLTHEAGSGAPAAPFERLQTVAMLAVRWLSFAVALSVASFAVDGLWLKDAGADPIQINDLVSAGKLIDTANIVQLVTTVVGAVLFLVWLRRAYGNLGALGVGRPRRERGWAVGGWFVPLVNLVIPKQVANDVWRAGEPDLRPGDPGWQARPVAPVVHWWWALWLSSGVSGAIAGNLLKHSHSLSDARAAVTVDLVSQLLTLGSGLTAIAMVKGATRRQESRARLLGSLNYG